MNPQIFSTVARIKHKYEKEGFIILGVFGSFARGEEKKTSDVDILYRCTDKSFTKYPGLQFFSLYERIKKELESTLKRKVDLADQNGLNEIGKKYILPEVRYVA